MRPGKKYSENWLQKNKQGGFMKKIFIIILLAIICLRASAQTLIDTNKLWYVVEGEDFGNSTTYVYKFNGDTTFGSFQYKKLYAAAAYEYIKTWSYSDAMREDSNSRVYLHTNSGDVLYYNFNLTKNDTFIFRGHKMFVDSVSTVSLNDNEKRKSIYFSDSIKCGDQWVAGIGSTHGLTYVGFLGCEFPTPPPNLYLSCFFENDTLNYPNTTINYCDQEAIGVNEIQNKKDIIRIFPNPAIDNITIETHQKSTMEILNIQGQTILQQQIQQGKTNIDISGLAKGVYILRLNNNDKTAVTKIVKE